MSAVESSKYRRIADELRGSIQRGELRAGDLLCTERSLCEKYGVSRITAKRAVELLEDEGLITRRRGAGSFVGGKADKHDKGKAHKQAVPQNIALVLPFNIVKGGLFRELETAADILSEAGFFFSLHVSRNERETLESVLRLGVSGLMYYPMSEIPEEILAVYEARGLPVVILDKPHSYPQYSSVVCDNRMGMTMLTEHITAYGHKKTAYLSRFADNIASIRERFAGYVDALESSGGGRMPRYVKLGTEEASNQDALKHIVVTLRKEGVTALLCENDEVAFTVLMCCRSLGLRVPEDMSITGFDNIEWAVTGDARITTVDQNFARIGTCAAELLTKPDYSPKHIRVPVSFVPRASTGLPPE